MKRAILILAASAYLVATPTADASARDIRTDQSSRVVLPAPAPGALGEVEPPASHAAMSRGFRGARLETLWIFDADFEDLAGDNAGWTSYDRSGTLAQANYWHHDTIRLTEPYLGDSTWWCGTHNICWVQPRGYGNDWLQILERNMVEIEGTSPGDIVELEWDQRYAMERNYDYGHVEVSDDDGTSWSTMAVYNNTGFQGAGIPHDWDHPVDGHVTLDLSEYAGQAIRLRYRFESDWQCSSQDEYDNLLHSLKDGAWQLDNITVEVNGSPVFYDDCESGNMGWIHDDTEASGQTGVVFSRGRFGIDFVTGRGFTCENRPVGSWMYAAVDPFTSTMVDGQSTWLVSPPIYVGSAERLVGQWDMWVDCPDPTEDLFDLSLASSDLYQCTTYLDGFIDEEVTGGWYTTSPHWNVWTDNWDRFAGNDWLAIEWMLWSNGPPEEPHMAGIFLNRQRVGVPSGDAGTRFEEHLAMRFNDWFQDDLPDALDESAGVRIFDDDGIASAFLVATNDGGETWEAYACVREDPGNPSNLLWIVPPPVNQMTPGSEILYYYEATDSVGNVATYPEDAPNRAWEFSILPITGSTTDPGLLLVDKTGLGPWCPTSADRTHFVWAQHYYREALGILGFEFDVYDVEFPGLVGGPLSNGPDTSGMKYYDTQIWFAGGHSASTIKGCDQWNLIQWLNQSGEGKERNLLLTGNNIGTELMGDAPQETLNFYTTWLASNYVADAVGVATVDSVPGLLDRAGGFDFVTHDDGECILAGGCPDPLEAFDVVDARPGVVGNEVFADYEREDLSTAPAGVAYTHPTMGYQTINLGFGIEYVMDGTNPDNPGNYTPEGYHHTGIRDRVALMGNVMQYFGLTPDGPGTDVAEGGIENMLSHARPNPFNPVTRIDYSVREAGPVVIEIYSVAGRAVRRLLDAEVEAGTSGSVVWDGTNDSGERCASGVYFYRIVAPGFAATRRMVLLK
jgi:hypothetical protein